MRQRLLTSCRPSASDAHLARRAAAGDDDAFDKLYTRYQPRLEAYCRSIVRHDEDARDAVQNAMTKALIALRRDTEATNVQGWLFRIAHNEAISLLRRRRPTSELPDVMSDSRHGPASDLLLREELRATLDNVRALPGNLQHPLLLRELAGLSYIQVAEVVGGTPAAARKAVFDARTALSADRAGRDEACAVIRQSLSEGDGRRRRARIVRSHLQSCNACCAWESEQRLRRHHLAALLPTAGAVGSAGGLFGGLFGLLGGGSGVAAGVSGGLATNAKVAASLAVIAAGATPVVKQVEREAEGAARVTASAAAAHAVDARRRARPPRASTTAAVKATVTAPPPRRPCARRARRPRAAAAAADLRAAARRDAQRRAARRRGQDDAPTVRGQQDRFAADRPTPSVPADRTGDGTRERYQASAGDQTGTQPRPRGAETGTWPRTVRRPARRRPARATERLATAIPQPSPTRRRRQPATRAIRRSTDARAVLRHARRRLRRCGLAARCRVARRPPARAEASAMRLRRWRLRDARPFSGARAEALGCGVAAWWRS